MYGGTVNVMAIHHKCCIEVRIEKCHALGGEDYKHLSEPKHW